MAQNLQNGIFKKLSDREFDIASNIIKGISTSDIATKFGLKNNTVSTVKKNIFFKMGVKSAIDLYKLAIKEGICKAPKSNN